MQRQQDKRMWSAHHIARRPAVDTSSSCTRMKIQSILERRAVLSNDSWRCVIEVFDTSMNSASSPDVTSVPQHQCMGSTNRLKDRSGHRATA